jgi:hypothetical protein
VESETFVFVGDKYATLELLPGASRVIEHWFVPLRAGKNSLPQVQVYLRTKQCG